jgi:hypothetical protein
MTADRSDERPVDAGVSTPAAAGNDVDDGSRAAVEYDAMGDVYGAHAESGPFICSSGPVSQPDRGRRRSIRSGGLRQPRAERTMLVNAASCAAQRGLWGYARSHDLLWEPPPTAR